MGWFKIRARDEEGDGYTYVGESDDSIETLAEKASQGQFIRLDNLLFMDRGDIKEWAEWDRSIVPTVFINPTAIFSIMQFHGDPRVTARK